MARPTAMPDLQNEFSWSKSRHEKFAECRRAYYYAYYGSWAGWEALAGTEVRELYVLKKLSSRWQWAGSVVHATLRQLLQVARATGNVWPLDRVLERTRAHARLEWAASRDKSYWREASRIVGLTEHEYGEVVPDAEWRRLYEQVIEGSLKAFYRSSVMSRILATPRERWLSVDELDSWDFEGTKIWVAVDFAYRDPEGGVHILDWKTGKEREVDHTQVGIYALYAQRKWGAAPDQVQGGLVYLVPDGFGEAQELAVAADGPELEACQTEMRSSIAAMKSALVDPARNAARMEAFPQHADRLPCRRCPFRRPCGRI
jgi:hypothetical protein